jgi:hypothetical protein
LPVGAAQRVDGLGEQPGLGAPGGPLAVHGASERATGLGELHDGEQVVPGEPFGAEVVERAAELEQLATKGSPVLR